MTIIFFADTYVLQFYTNSIPKKPYWISILRADSLFHMTSNFDRIFPNKSTKNHNHTCILAWTAIPTTRNCSSLLTYQGKPEMPSLYKDRNTLILCKCWRILL